MSKRTPIFLLIIAAFVLILQFFTCAAAQDIEAKITTDTKNGNIINVSGKNSLLKRKNLSFLLSSAGAENLGGRISDVKLFDKSGNPLNFKKFIAGEYVADSDIYGWSYSIDLTPPKDQAMAHISWIANNGGVFMAADMLPIFGKNADKVSAKITFDVPVLSSENKTGENVYLVSDVSRAIFYSGKNWRSVKVDIRTPVDLFIYGERQFTDADAAKMVEDIYGEYRKLFGADISQRAAVAIAKFPNSVNPGTWQAETRGRNVTIVSADMAFKTQSLQRLHEQLRHETFHLWLPNGVNLNGNYDWFYEGFALYQSLKTGVLLNQIRFDDFLDTLSRAHNIDNIQTRRLSLIEASINRWNGSDTQVYARGMLVAFMCDVALLNSSGGKRSVNDIFRQIFNTYKTGSESQDGNTAVLEVIQKYSELMPLVEKYVRSGGIIEWANELESAGMENSPGGRRTELRVKEKLSGRQKALLDKLGYNSWRKLSVKSR